MPPWRRLTSPNLAADERAVLVFGCFVMGADGPSELGEQLAKALGFDGAASAALQYADLSQRIERSDHLTATEWAQAMVGTELAFIGDLLGAASDWEAIRGDAVEEDLTAIRNASARLEQAVVAYPLPRPIA